MIQITPEELIEFVRSQGSIQLTTGKQKKPFTVRVNANDFEIVPHSTQKARAHEMKWLRRVCERFCKTNSFRPSDYGELTVNASYTIAIIVAYLEEGQSRVAGGQVLPVREYEEQLAQEIRKASRDSSEARKNRLAGASKTPPTKKAISTIFIRNADVIVEVLLRAGGTCEYCKAPAPFKRRTDGTPYLEVHHRRPLGEGGEDTVENAAALCPNCHRKAHHG